MWRRQIVWLAIGIVVFFVAALVDYRAWLNVSLSLSCIWRPASSGAHAFYRRTTYGAQRRKLAQSAFNRLSWR